MDSLNRRVVYLDIVKCLAIFLVVWGHVIQKFGEDSNVNVLINHYWILTFHMPLFAIVSGMFFSTNKPFREFLENKLTRLILPLISWCFIKFTIIPNIQYLVNQEWTQIHVYASLRNAYYGITDWGWWFLRALFLCYLYSYITNKIIKKYNCISDLISIILLFFLSFSGIIPNKSPMLIGFVFLYPFFLSGKYLKKEIEKTEILFLLSSLLFYSICWYFWNGWDNTFYESNTSVFSPASKDGVEGYFVIIKTLQRFFIGISGSFLFIKLVKYFCKVTGVLNIKNILAKVGRHTLEIYIIHSLFIDYLPKIEFPCPLFSCFIFSIILMAISILVGKMLAINKTIRVMFLGSL